MTGRRSRSSRTERLDLLLGLLVLSVFRVIRRAQHRVASRCWYLISSSFHLTTLPVTDFPGYIHYSTGTTVHQLVPLTHKQQILFGHSWASFQGNCPHLLARLVKSNTPTVIQGTIPTLILRPLTGQRPNVVHGNFGPSFPLLFLQAPEPDT